MWNLHGFVGVDGEGDEFHYLLLLTDSLDSYWLVGWMDGWMEGERERANIQYGFYASHYCSFMLELLEFKKVRWIGASTNEHGGGVVLFVQKAKGWLPAGKKQFTSSNGGSITYGIQKRLWIDKN